MKHVETLQSKSGRMVEVYVEEKADGPLYTVIPKTRKEAAGYEYPMQKLIRTFKSPEAANLYAMQQ